MQIKRKKGKKGRKGKKKKRAAYKKQGEAAL